jgi:excisionase family DNA binding protein
MPFRTGPDEGSAARAGRRVRARPFSPGPRRVGGPSDERWLTEQDIVRELHVDARTVRRWLRDGQLRGQQTGGRRLAYRVSETELRRFLRARGAEQATTERDD